MLSEAHRHFHIVKQNLYQHSARIAFYSLVYDEIRLQRFQRPHYNNALCVLQLFINHLAKLLPGLDIRIPPDGPALSLENLHQALYPEFVGPRITDKDVAHFTSLVLTNRSPPTQNP